MKIKNVVALVTLQSPGTEVDTDENFLGLDEETVWGGPDGSVIIPKFNVGDTIILGCDDGGGLRGIVCAVKEYDPQGTLSRHLQKFHISSEEQE